MIKLHGFPVSHYYNMVKHTLITKEVAFEELVAQPATDPSYFEKSPLGKIPCLETAQGCLSETSVILDYIEDCYPQQPLSPSDAWQRAKMKELIKVIELYVESQGRRLIPAAMGGAQLEQVVLDDASAVMNKGLVGIRQLGQFAPYLMGEQLTLADIVLRYSLVVVNGGTWLPDLNTAVVAGIDLPAALPQLASWEQRMNALPASKQIDARVRQELPNAIAERRKQRGDE